MSNAQSSAGIKYDSGKPRWELLPLHVIEDVVRVLTFGAAKYSDDNWKKVADDNHKRYFSAAMRHMAAWQSGETMDSESGLPHLAHAICCLVFLCWHAKEVSE